MGTGGETFGVGTMNTIHMLLLAVSCCALAASAAGGRWLRRSGTPAQPLQMLGLIIGGALIIGNAACLLPGTPRWYSVAMVAATAAGLVWLTVTVAGERQPEAAPVFTPPAPPVTRYPTYAGYPMAGTPSAHPTSAHPASTYVTSYGAGPSTQTLRLIHGEGQSPPAAPNQQVFTPTLITNDDMHEAGPHGSRQAASNTVYVAANVDIYLSSDRNDRRRTPGTSVARRPGPDRLRRHLQLARVYHQPLQIEKRSDHSSLT